MLRSKSLIIPCWVLGRSSFLLDRRIKPSWHSVVLIQLLLLLINLHLVKLFCGLVLFSSFVPLELSQIIEGANMHLIFCNET
jgi:hypothetical protein